MTKILALLLLAASLSGCALYTPGGAVVIDPSVQSGKAKHCPPGQAKRGNC